MKKASPRSDAAANAAPHVTAELLSRAQSYLKHRENDDLNAKVLKDGWSQFYNLCKREIRYFAFRCGAGENDTADCLQDVWIELIRRSGVFQLDPSRGQFETWLFRIVQSKTADLQRARKRSLLQENAETLNKVADHHLSHEDRSDAHEMVNFAWDLLQGRLSKLNLQVLQLRLVDQLSVAEVAEKLGLTREQVRYRYHRARLELERTTMIPRKTVGLVLFVAVVAALSELALTPPKLAGGDDKAATALPTPQELLNALPTQLTAEIPGDVDRDLQQKLDAAKQFAEVQLLFDILSWRSFVALNWPIGADGKPQPSITDAGKKRWDTFKPSDDVFHADGSKPTPWGQNHTNARYLKLGAKPGERVLSSISAVHGTINTVAKVNDVLQAFKYPIWDQNGFMLRYSIAINKEEFDYVVDKELYNLEGQAAFWKTGKSVSFPKNDPGEPQCVGAIEVKLAWKVLKEDKGDLPGRFITTTGIIFTGTTGETPETVTLGLVGMHISHKTQSSPQWIWSTFMHVDALQTNALDKFEGKPIKTLFANPQKEYLPVNIPDETLKPFVDGRPPTQVSALTPIPLATQAVNKVAQIELQKRGSVLQYYQLLNTQWPVKPSDPPSPPGTYPDSLTNKSGGRPTPVYLINPLMETYFQGGNQAFGNLEDTMPPADKKLVFGTESCVGCHYSAAIATNVAVDPLGNKSATFGPSQSADFSWLLQQRAHFKDTPKK